MKSLILFVLPVVLLSCATPTQTVYPEAAKTAFMSGCPRNNWKFCGCTFDKIATTVPFETLLRDIKKHGGQFIYERPYIDAGLNCSKLFPK